MALFQRVKYLLSHPTVRQISTSQHIFQQARCDGSSTSSMGRETACKSYLLSNIDQPRVFDYNVRLEDLRITVDYLKKFSALPALQIEQKCPQHESIQTSYEAPSVDQSKVVIFEINPKPALQDPADTSLIIDEFVHKGRLECHRMLIIRKKKMRNHRRKRLWKKMWPIWRKKFSSRFKKTEVGLRAMLTEKVNSAKNFNAKNFVKEYLDDYHFELIPKTYQGGRKPTWFVKEMLEKDQREEHKKYLRERDLFSKEPLIRNNESVEDFVKRNN